MKIGELNLEDALSEFCERSLLHHNATQEGDFKSANKQAERINYLFEIIKRNGDDGRNKLLGLINSDERSIASMAAAYSMRYRPEVALTFFRKHSRDKDILGLKAKYAVKNWENGQWHID